MQPFRFHVLLCTHARPENVPGCAASGAEAVARALHTELDRQGLADEILVSRTDCLNLCEHGPVMVVYPDAIWYGGITVADVPEIVRSHLQDGNPVRRLVLADMTALRREALDQKAKTVMEAREVAGLLPESLLAMARGFQASRVLLTAIELDLFSAVGNGSRAQEVAAVLRTNPRATEMLLNAVTALGLLHKSEGVFTNTATTSHFLVEGSPDNARLALMHTVYLWPRWATLTECVREGSAVYPRNRNEQLTRAFIASMDRHAKEAAPPMVRAIPTEGARRMLDLGGGSGAYSIAMARAHPDLQVEILDLPAVAPLTEDYVRKAGLSDRIRIRKGDMRAGNLGNDYDLILLGAICHMFTPEQNRDLFRRACAALVPQGRLVVRDFILEPEKTAPTFAALFSLNMLVATEGGASYSAPEYEHWLREAGFAEVRRVRLPGPGNLMIGTRQ